MKSISVAQLAELNQNTWLIPRWTFLTISNEENKLYQNSVRPFRRARSNQLHLKYLQLYGVDYRLYTA